MIKPLVKKVLQREVILYLFFGVVAVILNIVLFHLFVNVLKMTVWLGNLIDTIICVLFQYLTNRLWVFQSQNKGKQARREFYYFLLARGVTAIIDQIIVVVGVSYVVANLVVPDQRQAWGVGVKIISNAIVIVLNYVFSKKFIFKPQSVRKGA